ncbi:MAG TPA: NAD-dependent epimerase/dehydratase family protein [Xanthobacteraceae bacterium]|nr:NAD-dependent epimerase/dehydratase family protein [Xanthobacteraceae bacterium]
MTVTRLATKRDDAPVLVTGGCGFLGCNIAATLASRGRSVVAADNLSRAGARINAGWLRRRFGNLVEIAVVDVRDRAAVDDLVGGAAAVLHLAGQVAVTTSLDEPVEDFEINAGGTLNVLEAVRRHNPAAPVIFASTNKVYGRLLDGGAVHRVDGRYAPDEGRFAAGVSEDAPLDFHSPYGCSKGAADQYVHDYARVHGLRTVVLRMSCIYGPRQFGTEDQGWIAHFLLQALRGQPITIYGDGYQVRDALYVGDAVNAWLGTLDAIETTRGQVFNLGGGPASSLSLRELLDWIEALHGARPDVRMDAWRPGDQPWYVSDVRKLSRAIGWTPSTPLREGLRALDDWLSAGPAQPDAAARLQEAQA